MTYINQSSAGLKITSGCYFQKESFQNVALIYMKTCAIFAVFLQKS